MEKRSFGFTILRRSSGFTIVELLVVIVVIGILAAITIVSYTGMSQKANIASLVSDLDNASRQLKLYQVTSTTGYPTSLDANYCPVPADSARCLKPSPGISYIYVSNNTTTPQTFCVTAIKGSTSYKITNDSAPVQGNCLDYGLALNLDASNTTSYPSPFTGTTWTDLSGNNNNGTLSGAGYNSENGGTLTFDGVNDYVNVPNSTSLNPTDKISLSAWIKPLTPMGSYGVVVVKPIAGWTSGGYGLSRDSATDNLTFWLNTYGNKVSIPFSYSTWQHVVATYDGATMKIFKNGALVDSKSYAVAITQGTQALRIGLPESYSYPFSGSISKVRIYNRALTTEEALILYNS